MRNANENAQMKNKRSVRRGMRRINKRRMREECEEEERGEHCE